EAHLGRLPTIADGATPTAVLGYGFWQRRFGGDPSVIGRTVRLNGAPQQIVGVLPREFIIPNSDNDIFIAQSLESNPRRDDRGTNFLRGIARLKPGVTLVQAQEEFAALTRRLGQLYPNTNATITAPRFVPLPDEVVGRYGSSVLLLLAASGALIAIMCANLAGLLVARSLARR